MTIDLSVAKRIAVQCGANIERNSCNAEMLTSFTEYELLAFAQAIYAMGAAEQKEKDAKICEQFYSVEGIAQSFAEAIRSQE